MIAAPRRHAAAPLRVTPFDQLPAIFFYAVF